MILLELQQAINDVLTAQLTAPVYDGYLSTDDDLREYVLVGADLLSSDDASEVDTNWHNIPWGDRHEQGFVRVVVGTQSGDDTFTEIRSRNSTLVNNVFDVIGSDPTFGVSASVMDPQITQIKARHRVGVTGDGRFVETVLDLHFQAVHNYQE